MSAIAAAISAASSISAARGAAGSRSSAADEAAFFEAQKIERLRPFVDAGTEALTPFRTGIDEIPTLASSISAIKDDPGFQFELDTARDVVQGSAAAKNNLISGRTLTALQEFGQGLASTRSGQAFDRSLRGQAQKQGQLSSLISGGRSAAGAASALPDIALRKGEAQAGGQISQANTINSALENFTLSQLLKKKPATGV